MRVVKERLRTNTLSVGSWITLAHPAIAQMLVDAGFEWIVIDLEHSVISLREAEELMHIVEAGGASPLVRLTSNDINLAKRVMDAGAHGVIVPQVNTVAEARQAVAMVRYPPSGTRGVGLARAQGYGPGFGEYVESLADNVIVIAQIEHVDAISRLEDILAVPGIDGTIIGPYDLSASLGKPGQFEDGEVKAALARYEHVCKTAGKTMGYHVIGPTAEEMQARIAGGYHFVAFSTDFLFLGETCRRELARLRASQTAPPTHT